MLISVFTPTNKPELLKLAYDSLMAQTHRNWEWVILLNGGAGKVPEFITDSRIKVISSFSDMRDTRIGFLKKKAVDYCRGGILVELDHDDFLRHDALEIIFHAFDVTGADFVYSSCAEFQEGDNTPRSYGKQWGWSYYDYEYNGVKYRIPKLHPADPQFMLKITHAPNHVRSWRASSYRKIGGHNVNLQVGDDYDIINRMYVAGMNFHAIDECLYFYRWRKDNQNNTITQNAKIQEVVNSLYPRYCMDAALRWAKEKNLECLDLGAAHGKDGRFIGVDIDKESLGPRDQCCDLNKPWVWRDDSIGVIRAYDFIEHIPNKLHFWNEAWRVLAPGGFIFVEVPSTDGRGAFQDPTHNAFYNINSFWYLTDDNYKKYVKGARWAFWPLKLEDHYPSEWHKQNKILYTRAHLVCLKEGVKLPQPYPHMRIPK